MSETKGVVIQGLDIIEIIDFIQKKNKRYQAMLLQEVEEVMDRDSEEFILVRKFILDYLNSYTRSITRAIFGDVEHLRIR